MQTTRQAEPPPADRMQFKSEESPTLLWSLALLAEFNPAPNQVSKPRAPSHPSSFPRATQGPSTPSFPHTLPSTQRIPGLFQPVPTDGS